jgi:type III secretion protein J
MVMRSSATRYMSFAFLFCIFLALLTSCGSSKTIVNGLDEREANEILVFLAGKNIKAAKAPSGEGGGGASKLVLWDIQVSTDQANEAMAYLNQAGLPRRRGQNLLGIFSAGSLVPSELQEQIRYQAGLAEQIANTIRKIDGVLDAEVQISFPKENPLEPSEKQGKITASVYVKHNGVLDDPNSHLTSKIKRLVASSVASLDYDNVTVISDRARFASSSDAAIGATPQEEKHYVSIWSIIIAQESVQHFRIIFFSFLLTILLLLLLLVWMGWKIYPLLKKHGGIKELFTHVHPISDEPKVEVEEKAEEETKKAASAAKEKSEEEKLDKDMDET